MQTSRNKKTSTFYILLDIELLVRILGLCQMLTRPRRSVVTITSSRKYTPTHGSACTVLTIVGWRNATWSFDWTGCKIGVRSSNAFNMFGAGWCCDETELPRYLPVVVRYMKEWWLDKHICMPPSPFLPLLADVMHSLRNPTISAWRPLQHLQTGKHSHRIAMDQKQHPSPNY